MFFYHQISGGEDAWIEAVAEGRASIIKTKQPRYTTVLDLSELLRDDMTREQIAAIRYRGPLYFDWDAPDIGTTIEKVHQFAARLNGCGVDLNSVRWYATGGRGFHAEIAMDAFIAKPPPKGLQHLPLIYREMAFELFTDTMDMRVYSAKRGRMWRTPNVQRENLNFKVPLTTDELLAITPDQYAILVRAPRPEPQRAPPEFNADLALMYEKARAKIEGAAKKRQGTKDIELLKRFKGEWPPTIQRILQGEGIAPGAGFHQMAMQIAITANAIGKTEEATLVAAERLIETHQSDGNRYNTPAKRRDELSRLLDYTRDNVCYTYSKGPIKVLCAPGTDTADLDGMPDDAGENLAASPDNVNGEKLDLRGGLEMRETGVYKKDQEQGVTLISDISFKEVRVLLSLPKDDKPAELWGFEADVYQGSKLRGRQQLDMQVFLSKARYNEFCLRNLGVMKGADNDVASLATILRDMAVSNGKIAYVVRREGMDYVVRPESNPPQYDLVWVETSGVYGNTDMPYVFRPQVPSGSVLQSDLWKAPPLTGSEDERVFFTALFNMNDPQVIAPFLGWFTSCFHRMIYDAVFQKFPLLNVFAQAGSGKTETTLLLANMHFYSSDPLNLQCTQLTPYYLQVHASASASVPLVLDEYKPRQMPAKMKETLPNVFRAAYNNGAFGKGGEGEQIGQGWKSISKLSYSAPILFIGEALETESAIMERAVAVPMSKAGIVGRSKNLRIVQHGRKIMSSAGRSILAGSFGIELPQFEAAVERSMEATAKLFRPDTQHRVVYNLAVVLTGFDFFSDVLRQYFGGALDSDLARLREAILRDTAAVGGSIMAEASKVLQDLAFMSSNEDATGPYGLRNGTDYLFSTQAGIECIDVKMQVAYVRYVAWCRNKGQVALYDNFEAFCHGLAHYAPLVDKTCLDSPLKETGLVKVYRFSLQKLIDEGVQAFKKG